MIDYWWTLIGPNSNLLVYPGADEVAAAMAARLLSQQHGVQVSFRITCVDAAGLGRVAPFENVPIATTLKRQIQAAGGVSTDAIPDVEIVVHAPSPTGGDFYESRPDPTPTDLIQQTVAAVAAAFERGVHVAVADCRWPNGSDPALAEALHAAGMLDKLVAYGGWNTAGNTIGSVVAAASAAVIGKRTGSYDGHAQRRFLLTRIIEDYGYQAIARHELNERGFPNDLQKLTGAAGEAQAELVRVRLNEILHEIDANWNVVSIRFPWHRGFEIGLQLEPVDS